MSVLRIRARKDGKENAVFFAFSVQIYAFGRPYRIPAPNAHSIITHFRPNFYNLWKIFCIYNCKLFVNE